MKKAIFQYGSARYCTVFINLLLTSILSRILTPEDYGIISVIMVFCTFFNTLATMGLGTGIIQNKSISYQETEGIFSFSAGISILLWFFFWLLSYPVSWFYGDKIYIGVMKYLSISVLLNSLNVIPNALILKAEKFRLISVRMIVSALISGFISIVIALKGGKYYSLIVQNILIAGIPLFWNMASLKLHIRIKPNLEGLKKIGNYSFFQFLYSVILALSQNLDDLLVGKYVGSEQLAYYNKSYTVMRYPINYIPHAVSPVLHPILSKYQEDKNYIYDQYLKIIKVVSAIGLFVSFVFIWEAEEIVLLLFGSQWKDSVSVIRIFGFSIWFQVINAMAGSIYQSVNATKNMFLSGVIHISISIFAIIIGIVSGSIDILAMVLTISWGIKFIIESVFLVKKSLNRSVKDYWRIFLPELLIFCVMSIAFYFLFPKIRFSLMMNLIVKTCSIIAVFSILYISLGQYKFLLNLRSNKFGHEDL